MFDTKTFSLAKAISWRFIATGTTTGLVYAFTNEAAIAFTIGGLEVFVKILLYYIHERIWNVL